MVASDEGPRTADTDAYTNAHAPGWTCSPGVVEVVIEAGKGVSHLGPITASAKRRKRLIHTFYRFQYKPLIEYHLIHHLP